MFKPNAPAGVHLFLEINMNKVYNYKGYWNWQMTATGYR